MRNSNGLYKLIKSLKNSEKANFRLFAGRSPRKNKYLILFNRIDKETESEKCNDRILMKELGYKSRETFYVIKNYLFESILSVLCAGHFESSMDDTLRNRILSIKILYEKTLFSKASELLKKAKKMSLESENYLRLLEILKWEKNLVIEGAVKGQKNVLLDRIYEDEDIALRCIANISSYRLLSFRFNSFVKESSYKSKKELNDGLKYFITHPLLKNENKAVTLASKIMLLEISAFLNILRNEHKKVYTARKSMINLMDANPVFRNVNLTNYVISLYNFANDCFKLGYIKESIECIKKLRETPSIGPGNIAASTKLLINIGSLRLEITKNLKLNEFRKASENSILLAEIVKKNRLVLTANEIAESLALSIAGLFLYKQYSSALDLINVILKLNFVNIDNNIMLSVKLMQILVLFEAGGFDTCDYHIVSLQRNLNKMESGTKSILEGTVLLKQALSLIKAFPSISDLIKQIGELLKASKWCETGEPVQILLRNWINARV